MAPKITPGARVTAFTQEMISRVAGTLNFFSTQAAPGAATVIRPPTAEPWFGPGRPMLPAAPAQDVKGRAFDYPNQYNIQIQPRAYEGISFGMLKRLADASDMVRLAIETRKDQFSALEWSIQPKMAQGQELRSAPDARCAMIEAALQYPDRRLPWHAWQRKIIEEQLVTDAVSIYVRPDMGGRPYSFEVLDGETIAPKLDLSGREPEAPAPAYQQRLKGMPAVDYSSDELIYAPRNPRNGRVYGCSPVEQIIMTVNIAIRREVSKLQFYCYSDDTEVLTKRGWLRFAETTSDDQFATRQINTAVFEWQKPYDTFYKHYTGELIHFTGRSLDLLVTPHHRMLVNVFPGAMGRKPKGEHVITAEELERYGTPNVGLPQTSVWAGEELGDQTFTDANPHSWDITLTGDQYCAFMGMYLAEGNLRKRSIAISQPPDTRGAHEKYGALLKEIFGSVSYCGHQFEVGRKALVEHLRQFGKAGEKFIPETIKGATPRQLKIFFEHYMLGDGTAFGDRGGIQQAFTVSRRLSDDLTEIGQKLGYAPAVFTRKAGKGMVGDREVNQRVGYMITFGRRKATKGWTAKRVNYDAPVACVCVPNKFLYVRRNGKAVWSGNTEGTVPEALASVPKEWGPDKIKEFQDIWDTMLADQATKRRLKFVPGDMTFQPTRADSSLQDPYDEWLARVIMFAFSLPALPFVKMQNRATADTAYETALEEGLQPMMTWFKTSIMDRIIQRNYGFTDVEFVWKDVDDVDPGEQQTRDLSMIQVGVKSIDEVRAGMGLQPIGMTHAIWGIGPAGIMFVSDLVQARDQGLLQIQPPAPPPMMAAGDPNDPMDGGPGFVDGGSPAPGSNAAPMLALPAPRRALPAPGQPGVADALAGVPPKLLAAVGLGPAGPAGRSVDVTSGEETASDPLARHAANPTVLRTLRAAERTQQNRRPSR